MATDPTNTLDSVMKYEIEAIKRSRQKTTYYDIQATIHTPKGDLKILYPVRFDRLKDFVGRYSDVINLSVAVQSSMMAHDIFPNQDSLEVTLKLLPLKNETTYTRELGKAILNKRYVARLTDHRGSLAEGNVDTVTNKHIPGKEMITVCTFQLVDKVVMALRSKTVGLIARKAKPMDVIKYCLTEHSKDLGSGDSEKISGVTVVPGYTEEEREHIIVPHLTRLTTLPRLVNEAVGGIYPTGFSYYLHGDFWHVFPLYDTTRFAKSDLTLTIINVPKNRLPGIEKTWRMTPTQVIIMSTGEVQQQDTSISDRDTYGTATRFVDARKVIEGFGTRKDNKFTTNFETNVTEASLNLPDSDPTQQAVHQEIKVTSGYNLEYSKLAERAGSKMMITWENSDDSVVYPGMPVRYMFLVNGVPHQLYGTLLAAETMTVATNRDPAQKRFGSTTTLSCFMSRDITNRTVQ